MTLCATPEGRGRESGAATILVLGIALSLVVVTASALLLAGAVVASHRARLAADLAALAGANVLVEGAPAARACATAQRVATSNGAKVTACAATGFNLDVSVTVPARPWPEPATARARAGPAAEPP